jgi:hypothetical protein
VWQIFTQLLSAYKILIYQLQVIAGDDNETANPHAHHDKAPPHSVSEHQAKK